MCKELCCLILLHAINILDTAMKFLFAQEVGCKGFIALVKCSKLM
jgi:hypothetical protein